MNEENLHNNEENLSPENTQPAQPDNSQVNIVNPTVPVEIKNQTNGIAIAGFVLALVGLFAGWIPVIGWIIWLLGLVLSMVGITKKPKGFAIAGLSISIFSLIISLLLIFGMMSFFSQFDLNEIRDDFMNEEQNSLDLSDDLDLSL